MASGLLPNESADGGSSADSGEGWRLLEAGACWALPCDCFPAADGSASFLMGCFSTKVPSEVILENLRPPPEEVASVVCL